MPATGNDVARLGNVEPGTMIRIPGTDIIYLKLDYEHNERYNVCEIYSGRLLNLLPDTPVFMICDVSQMLFPPGNDKWMEER